MLATGYLPRRWPSKYCRRYESLRLCSGWEQVVYSCLVTDEFCFRAMHLGNCTMNISFAIILTFLRFNSACAIKDCFVRFAFASLTTAVILNLRSVTCLSLPTQSQRRYFASLISTDFRKSPRPISISRLKMLPLLHL